MGRGSIPHRFSIIGAARSGLAAARFLMERNASVFLSDTCTAENLDFILASNELAHIPHEAGEHTDRVLDCEALILSPGVPVTIPVVRKAKRAGIPVWSEIELAYRASKCGILAVTGSSGKSTTVSLLGQILTAGGKKAVVAGNIGTPAVSMIPSLTPGDWAVLEVSSFQLETIDRFRANGAAVINLMKNHLDRYKSYEEYCDAKKRIARNLTAEDVLVLNREDPALREWGDELSGRTRIAWFGLSDAGEDCVWYADGLIRARVGETVHETASVDKMKLRGLHNYQNAAAAAALALFGANVAPERLADGLYGFAGLPHRLELVGEIGGVKYYNDSKATTAESVLYALQAFDGGVHLIAGGRDKGCDFASIRDEVARHARHVYVIGEAAKRIADTWRGTVTITRHQSLREAASAACAEAMDGEVVVLSPGCSSFDMFRNFEERGKAFAEIVRELGEKKEKSC